MIGVLIGGVVIYVALKVIGWVIFGGRRRRGSMRVVVVLPVVLVRQDGAEHNPSYQVVAE